MTPARMSERELQESVRELCKSLGLLYFHAHDSRRSPAGFPDVVAVGAGGVLWAELKSQRGSLTPEQRRWGSYLERAGQRWYVLRPADLLDGTIRRLLLPLLLPRPRKEERMDIEDRAEKWADENIADMYAQAADEIHEWKRHLITAYLAGSAQTQADYAAHYSR